MSDETMPRTIYAWRWLHEILARELHEPNSVAVRYRRDTEADRAKDGELADELRGWTDLSYEDLEKLLVEIELRLRGEG